MRCMLGITTDTEQSSSSVRESRWGTSCGDWFCRGLHLRRRSARIILTRSGLLTSQKTPSVSKRAQMPYGSAIDQLKQTLPPRRYTSRLKSAVKMLEVASCSKLPDRVHARVDRRRSLERSSVPAVPTYLYIIALFRNGERR